MQPNINKRIITAAICLISCIFAGAQNVRDLIISEVLVDNETGLLDDYGQRNGWIEIFNTSQGTVDFGGCFLTDDVNNLQKYMIPKGDLSTKLGPRQVALFHAGGQSSMGTYYTGFALSKGSTVYLVSNDGKTIVDSIEIPANLPADNSVQKLAEDNKQLYFQTVAEPCDAPTPGAKNGADNEETGSQRVAAHDPHGWVLTITSVSVVFSALFILYLIFDSIGKAFKREKKPKAKPAAKSAQGEITPEVAAAISMALEQELGGGTYAAIAMALHLHFTESVHDNESFIITVKPTSGGWKSKGQTFRRLPSSK